MTASADDDRVALRSALRQYLAAGTGRPDDHGTAELDPSRWTRLAREMGVTGVRIPESLGGAGLGLEDELLVHEELGRALSDLPFLSTVGFAAAALAAAGDQQRLEAIGEGELVVGAVLEAPVIASSAADGTTTLDGVADCVADAPGAGAFLVAARDGDDPVLAWVEAGDAGVERLQALDLTRRFGRVTFAGASATVLARGDEAADAIDAGLANGYLALCAESVGLASRALELTVDYVKVRYQFGRPVGGFQAVKHRCADMVVALERARSAIVFAVAEAHGTDGLRARAALAVARMHCAEIPFWIADETIHLHGGIGFTWEHTAHLFYRRAKSNQVWLDPHGGQRREIAALVTDMYAREGAAR